MMNDIVLLEYCFMFEPSKAWSNLYQFEGQLLKFFEGHNMNAEVVKYVAGQNGKRMVYLSPKEEIKENPIVPPRLPKQQVDTLRNEHKLIKREKDGKYI